MVTVSEKGYYFPPGFLFPEMATTVKTYEGDRVTVRLEMPVITPALISSLSGYLKMSRKRTLSRMPIERIVNVLDRASRLWLDPEYPLRKTALASIPLITGFSRESVEAALDIEMETSLKEDIWKALKSEIKNPLYLDDFQYSPELNGYCRAFGPELIISIFSENIPSLPHLLYMRSALVKAACLGKTALGEPLFAALYLKSLEEIDPEMVESMAALHWPGGDAAIEDTLFSQADAAVAFGSVETCASLMRRIPRHVRVLTHGHRMGFGVIGKNRLNQIDMDGLAQAVAYDHAMFDQKACLAPQVYYVEQGGEVSAEAFSRAVARSMMKLEKDMPRGTISPGEAALIHQLRAGYEIRELNGEDVLMIASAHGTAWTVVYEKNPGQFSPSPLNRFVRIWAVDDISEVLQGLKPMGRFLQNAAVMIGDGREKGFVQSLGELGVARITSAGKMPTPSMMWHHDGMATLASLLRWCDVEKKEWEYENTSIHKLG